MRGGNVTKKKPPTLTQRLSLLEPVVNALAEDLVELEKTNDELGARVARLAEAQDKLRQELDKVTLAAATEFQQLRQDLKAVQEQVLPRRRWWELF